MRTTLSAVLIALMVGCAAGPDFHSPDPPAVGRYTAGEQPSETASADAPGGQAQRFVERDLPAEWWKLFQSDKLDALVRQALGDSPRLVQAQSKLVKAQQDLRARRGATQFPKVDARLSGTRVDVNPESFDVPQLPIDTPFTLYDASVTVSYTLDLFGKSRRELEGLQARVDYQGFELEAARLTLAGNVATAAIQAASLRDQIAATEGIVALQERRIGILERREQAGGVAKIDVVTQRGELAKTRASLPPLRERLEQTRNRLAVYLGQLPGEAELPELGLSDLQLPSELPLSLPSELVRRRPDIRAAEALLHEASAQVGVATANFYPQIIISGVGGSLATALSSLFSSGTGFYLLGATLVQKLFHGGELKAQKRSAVAAFEQAGGVYREVVLEGFQDVADTLAALDQDAQALRDRAEAASLAKTAFEINTKRFEAGGISTLDLLDSERQSLAASLDQTRALADRFADSAALFQALGGGWWSAQPPAGATSSPTVPQSQP
ncbi:MAG TPA: efflux transporter outer membrane subunit [Candidatus Polarisedimenticolia bacterium]|nr:efflux transporter outer membrane subunit [Candidatus Polarisedimenticolia bacterium]